MVEKSKGNLLDPLDDAGSFEEIDYLEGEAKNEGIRADFALFMFIVFFIPIVIAITFLSVLLLPDYFILLGDLIVVVLLYYSRIYILHWSMKYIRSRNKWILVINISIGVLSIVCYCCSVYYIASGLSYPFTNLFGTPAFDYNATTFEFILKAKAIIYLLFDEVARLGGYSWSDIKAIFGSEKK